MIFQSVYHQRFYPCLSCLFQLFYYSQKINNLGKIIYFGTPHNKDQGEVTLKGHEWGRGNNGRNFFTWCNYGKRILKNYLLLDSQSGILFVGSLKIVPTVEVRNIFSTKPIESFNLVCNRQRLVPCVFNFNGQVLIYLIGSTALITFNNGRFSGKCSNIYPPCNPFFEYTTSCFASISRTLDR